MVRGRSRRRISIAAPTCHRPGQRSRLIYRPRRNDGHRDGRKSLSRRDYRDLLIAAHAQPSGPIVLIRDNLNVHKAADLRKVAEARDWPTISCLPPYAPDLNPVEGIRSLLRRGRLSNVTFSTPNTSSVASDAAYGTSGTAATSSMTASPRPAWPSDPPERPGDITSSSSVTARHCGQHSSGARAPCRNPAKLLVTGIAHAPLQVITP